MATRKSSKTSSEAKKQSTPSDTKRIYRADENKVLGGVAGGIGEFFNMDPTLVRVVFVFLTIFGGAGVFLYLILWVIMPSKKSLHLSSKDAIRSNVEEMRLSAKQTADSLQSSSDGESRTIWAIILVVVGVLVLINNYGIFMFDFGKLWPIFLVILGILILRKR